MENKSDKNKSNSEDQDIWQQIENINIQTDEDADIVISMLKKLLIQEQTIIDQKKSLLDSLGINIESFDAPTSKQLTELSELQYQVGSSNCNHNNIILNHVSSKAEQLKEQRYERKIQLMIKSMGQNIDKIQKLTNKYNTDLQEFSDIYDSLEINNDEQEELSRKLKIYTAALKKLDDEHPELASSDNQLMKYQAEIDDLEKLKKQEKELNSKLSKYHGVSTDLNTLRNEVEIIKDEYKLLQTKLI